MKNKEIKLLEKYLRERIEELENRTREYEKERKYTHATITSALADENRITLRAILELNKS